MRADLSEQLQFRAGTVTGQVLEAAGGQDVASVGLDARQEALDLASNGGRVFQARVARVEEAVAEGAQALVY